MNILQHIEAGHYPKDAKGRALVPMANGGTFTVTATDKPQTAYNEDNGNKRRFIVGWDCKGVVDTHTEDTRHLLPPAPRKVKVTGGAIVDKNGNVLHFHSTGESAAKIAEEWSKSIAYCKFVPLRGVELTGEYEEPWS